MKQQWGTLADRFDALPLQARGAVLAVVVLITALTYQTLAIDPLLARDDAVTEQVDKTRRKLRDLQAEAFTASVDADPDATRRSYRDALRAQLEEVDRNITGLQKGLVPPAQMARLLQTMVEPGRGVTLVALRTLPVQRFDRDTGLTPVEASGASDKLPPPGERAVYRHTVEISVQGSYADLHDYLVRLEQLPWRMFWGKAELDARQHPVLVLKLTLHTLSAKQAWLAS